MNQKMINFDDVTKENIKQHNPSWPQIPDYWHRILTIRSSGKKIWSFYLISHQPDIDKIYLCTIDACEAKYQSLINKRESEGSEHLNYSKAFIEYSNYVVIWIIFIKTLNNTAQNKKCEILIVIDDLIADMLSNRTVNSIVTELFTRSGKLIITLVSITPFHFDAPKNIRLNSTPYFIMKIPKKRTSTNRI